MENKLHFNKKEEYQGNYSSDTIEIYKLYVSSMEKISDRRQTANSFFLSLNTVVIGFSSYFSLENDFSYYWIISIVGILISFIWYKLIISYKNINSGKFKLIHFMEKHLPISCYDLEWKILGEGKESATYLPFTKIELIIPWIFFFLHLLMLIIFIL